MQSERVGTIQLDIRDTDNNLITLSMTHGYAMQQGATTETHNKFYADLNSAMTSSKPNDIVVITMDTNCSIGAQRQDGAENENDESVVGQHGEHHINQAGRALRSWLANHQLYAASTHFRPRNKQQGYGTWRHPRSHKTYQNDHIFVKNPTCLKS
jgi:hypothetical protein